MNTGQPEVLQNIPQLAVLYNRNIDLLQELQQQISNMDNSLNKIKQDDDKRETAKDFAKSGDFITSFEHMNECLLILNNELCRLNNKLNSLI